MKKTALDAAIMQIKGTAMGTPMAPNYANLFLEDFEEQLLDDFFKKNNLKPLIWLRYIDDIFFIWTHGEESLKEFLNFAQQYSEEKKMKSKITFEIHQSENEVNFLDVTIRNNNGKISTTLYSKPTDSHLYLHSKSCHPHHVIRNIPKGQFLRLRRICSNTADYISKANTFIKYFLDRGYDKNNIENAAKTALKTSRASLLENNNQVVKKETQSIFVTTWHPKLKQLPSVMRKYHHLLHNDDSLKDIFPSVPLVAFRKKKSVREFVVRNDVQSREIKISTQTAPCGKCKKTCHLINSSNIIRNTISGQQAKSAGGSCKSKNVIYAVRCKKHDLLYIGHTGDELSQRMSKHRYDFNKRPHNNELTKHLAETNHSFETDIEVSILQRDVTSVQQREFVEDKFICRLGTKQPNGLNIALHQYGDDMYQSYQALHNENLPQSHDVITKF